jgi:phospholipase C
MDLPNRRDFLRMAGMAATAVPLWPGLISRALAIPANRRTGTLRDVEHIVVCMQENRSFDHYFGMLNGVRGFGDPRPLRLPGGRSVWAQPSTQHKDGYVLPFHGDSKTTQSFAVDGADQSHQGNMVIFNRGRYDRWGHSSELENRMLHYGPRDLPFYYALADAFTICDAYHCSTMTQTYPNRLHLFSGCNGGGTVGGDPEMSNYGEDETPSANMAEDRPLNPEAYRWTTYADRLQAAGVDWKVYQEYDNFGDNLLSVFPSFRPCSKDSELYRRGRSWAGEEKDWPDHRRSDGEQLVAAFRRDVETGKLPQISWIVTAADLSEHPKYEPSKGEHVVAKLIEALVDNREVFAKTVFILNYDEAGGFFDHAAPSVPPVGHYRGHSTVSLEGESKDYHDQNSAVTGRHPIGLGIRTPTVIVSPWSRGGFVCSELFDHTSVVRFMEARFGVREPNISAWRRSVCGDLTSAFDFTGSNSQTHSLQVSSTDDFRQRIARSLAGAANAIPAIQAATTQLPGQRPHRPLPYAFEVVGAVTADQRLRIEMINNGKTGVTLTVHDNKDVQEPWHYTVGAGDRFASEQWHEGGELTSYDLTLRGPNGYWRRYAGNLGASATPVEASLVAYPAADAIELILTNGAAAPCNFTIKIDDRYPTKDPRTRNILVAPGRKANHRLRLGPSDNWYDLTVTVDNDTAFLRRFAGKVDNGRPGRTDPGIGTLQLTV